MPGTDHLFAKSLIEIIKNDLGSKTVKKIENRLFEKFGLSLSQAVEEFTTFDLVLREFFGKGADAIERKLFEKIFVIKTKNHDDPWYSLSDTFVNSVILETYGDVDKRRILESVSETPKIINSILDDCNLPRTSGYRKINYLIDNGLLVKTGHIEADNKKINEYMCIFSNLKINIEKSMMTIDVQFNKSEQIRSSMLKSIPK